MDLICNGHWIWGNNRMRFPALVTQGIEGLGYGSVKENREFGFLISV